MDLIKYDDDDDNDDGKEMIFLINETGEDLFIYDLDNLQVNLIFVLWFISKDVPSKVDQNKSFMSFNLTTHEWMPLIVANKHQFSDTGNSHVQIIR